MMRRIFFFVVAPLLALVILLSLLLTWVAATESGLSTAWRAARGMLPGLTAETLEGRLIGPLKLRGLRFESETFELLINSVDFDWLPASLLQRALIVEQLHISGVEYTQLRPAPPKEDEQPFSLPASIDLPVSIALRDIALADLQYRATPEAQPFVVDSAALQASFAHSELQITKLTAHGPLFDVDAQAQAETKSAYASSAKIDLQARPPGYAPLAGSITVKGDLDDLHVEQILSAPYNVVVDARLQNIVEAMQFKAKLVVSDTELRAISESLPDINLNATANAGGATNDLGFSADIIAATAEFGTLKMTANGGFAQNLLNIQKLLLTVVDMPARLQAQGKVDLAGSAPELDLAANWQQLQWPLQGSTPIVISPEGKVDVTGTIDNLTAALNIALHDDGRIAGDVRRQGDAINVALDWRDVTWPISDPQVGSPKGKFSLTGTLQQYTLQANAKLKLPQETDGQLLVNGSGSDKNLNLETVRLDVLEGQIDGHADVAWQPNVLAKVNLQGKNLNPGILSKDWPGNLQFKLAADADQRDQKTVARVQQLKVTGQLRNQAVDVQVLGELRDEILRIKRFDLKSGPSVISVNGKLGETIALDWNIDSPDLASLLPQASGKLIGKGKLGGKLPWPSVAADVQGDKISYAEYSLQDLTLDADIDFQRSSESTLSLVAAGGKAAGVELKDLKLTGNGTREEHKFSLQADSSVATADINLDGKFADANWAIQLTEAQLKYGELDAWTLAAPQAGNISADKQALQSGCWTSGEAKLCLQGERTENMLQGEAQVVTLPFAYFDTMVPTDIALRGALNGDVEFSQQAGEEPKVDVALTTTASELRTRDAEQQLGDTLLALEPANIKAKLDANGLSALLDLPFVEQGGISGELTVPAGDAALTERPAEGKIDIAIKDLGFIASLSPEIEQASGAVNGALQLAGTLAKPEPSGKLVLSNGSLELAAPGLNITDLELQATATEDGIVNYAADASSGKGTLKLLGDADLSGDSVTTKMTLQGEDFQVFNTQDARVYVSPDLKIAVDDTGVGVTGEVRIPRAKITPKKLPESAVSVSDDQIIIKENSEDTETAVQRKVYAQIQLILGDDVSVDGFGFKGGVTGELEVTQKPGEPTIGSGELKITDGEYRAYGQGLVIEKGRILFAGGPINQPGVNVQAVRRPAEDIKVGVKVRGSLQQPDFTLFSDPAMSQSEQLSWLVLGRPLDDASDSEGDMVAQAAMALGVKGGNFLADKFGGDLGVDNIGFETGSGEAGAASDVNQAAFVIGKYLSPDLYVSYGIGLFESISTVKLEYTINDHWKVATESSTLSSGGDVKYTIER